MGSPKLFMNIILENLRNMNTTRMRCQRAVLYTILLLLPLSGCEWDKNNSAFSHESLFRTDIKTVYVKMFQNKSFYRKVEYDLTRALCQRIEHQLPYKVVSSPNNADTILEGTITGVTSKALVSERILDRPLATEIRFKCQVTWKNLKTDELYIDHQNIRVVSDYKKLLAQSQRSALQDAANTAAISIVSSMEKPW